MLTNIRETARIFSPLISIEISYETHGKPGRHYGTFPVSSVSTYLLYRYRAATKQARNESALEI